MGKNSVNIGNVGERSFFNSQEELEILLTAIEQTSVSMVITDLDADIIYVNNAFQEMTGYKKEEVIGENPRILKSGFTGKEVYEEMWDTISNGGIWNGEQINKKKDGSFYYEDSRITPIYDKNNKLKYYMALKHDITERKILESKLKDLAIRDKLTDTYNRWYLLERLKQISEKYKRLDTPFSIAIIDIDLFKDINDEFGHQAGDYVLKAFTDIIKKNIRSYDILGRYGGEEFIIVLPGSKKKQASVLISRILKKITNTDFIYDNQNITLQFSAGVADVCEVGKDNLDMEKLIELADKRLYKAKDMGRGKILME